MSNAQLGGTLGPFRDPTSGQQVSGQLHGSFSFSAHGDPNALVPRLQQALLAAANQVVSQKLAAGQLAIATIAHSLPHLSAEIIAHSGAQQLGAHITQLQLQANIQAPPPAGHGYGQGAPGHGYGQGAPAVGQMPPTPMQSLQNAARQHAEDALDPDNYEVRARINVGGLRINANTTDGIDTDGIAEQVADRAKSNLIWYGAGCVIVGLVFVGLAGLGWYIYATAKAPSPTEAPSGEAETAKWDGTKPFSCGSGDNLEIKGVKAKLSKGTAVTAGSNCHLTLTDVDIEAPTGIKALGNAVITVNGGSVKGKIAAATALGSGRIVFKGTKVEGKTKALGSKAKIEGP